MASSRVAVTFRKGDGARFLSHLDLMATFEYAIRRARLPVELSEGFNPRPRISVAAPLAVGYTGEREILDIALRAPVEPEHVAERLQAALPPGIEILAVEERPSDVKNAARRLRGAVYRIELPEPVPDLAERVDRLLAQATIEVEEYREGGMRRRDLRQFIRSLQAIDQETLRLEAHQDNAGTVRPEQVLDTLGVPAEGARITRERIELAG